MSQCDDILKHMENVGPITALEALSLYGCFRLAARINDLRDSGHVIHTDSVTLDNGKTVAQYSIRHRSIIERRKEC